MKSLIVFVLSLLVHPAATGDEPVCAKADLESARLISSVKGWAASGESAERARRDSMFAGVVLRDSAIVLETDEAVCRKLAEIYAALPGEVSVPASLYVARIGATHYAVFDPNDMSGSQRTVMIFDSSMALRGSWQDR